MKIIAAFLSTIAAASAFVPASLTTSNSVRLSETKADLVELAEGLNPLIKFWDPIGLADSDFYEMGETGTIGFLRHAEIKHGRVAMAAFVGYVVQSNYHFPWAQTLAGAPHPSIDLSPEQQWDATPEEAKWQIFTLVAFLEIWDEASNLQGVAHYTKGRMPGKFPSLQPFRDNVHFILDLYDPFGFNKKKSEESKARGRLAEINNGRLAMLGIFSFLVADKIPGSVPALEKYAIPYDGNPMIPFEGNFQFFPQEVAADTVADTAAVVQAAADTVAN